MISLTNSLLRLHKEAEANWQFVGLQVQKPHENETWEKQVFMRRVPESIKAIRSESPRHAWHDSGPGKTKEAKINIQSQQWIKNNRHILINSFCWCWTVCWQQPNLQMCNNDYFCSGLEQRRDLMSWYVQRSQFLAYIKSCFNCLILDTKASLHYLWNLSTSRFWSQASI